MSSVNNNNYRYKSDEFSIVKRAFALLSKSTDINLNKYNLNKIHSYTCKGHDLIGSSSNTQDPRRHFLVKNNHYKVYEIPMKSNKGLRMTGKFLVLFKNLDFGYWSASFMEHEFIKTQFSTVTEKVSYECIGEFELTMCNDSLSIRTLTAIGNKCCRGTRSKGAFDSDNRRKEDGYHTTTKVINRTFGIKTL